MFGARGLGVGMVLGTLALGCGLNPLTVPDGAGGDGLTGGIAMGDGAGHDGSGAAATTGGAGGGETGGQAIGGHATGGAATGGQDTGGQGGQPHMLAVGDLVPDFSLIDQNSTSPTATMAVSPRDYLEAVSGWYFGHAT